MACRLSICSPLLCDHMKNILVCMKSVPATTQVQVDGDFRLKREGVGLQWNIADESALEAALQLKGQGGTVTVLTMGPPKLAEALKELLSRGADRAVLLTDPMIAGADTYATARALSSAVRCLGSFDLILCGRRAMDGETGQVPPMLAAALSLPCITDAEALWLDDGQLSLRRRLENGMATLAIHAPAVVSLCEYSYALRLPSILSMRRAQGVPVEQLSVADIGLDAADCGLSGSLTKVIRINTKFPGLRNGSKETDISSGVSKLLQLCRGVRA